MTDLEAAKTNENTMQLYATDFKFQMKLNNLPKIIIELEDFNRPIARKNGKHFKE